MSKTEVLTVRLLPKVKQALAEIAAQERRSLANMIEVMVLDYCARNGVTVDQHDAADSTSLPGRSKNI